MDQSDSIKRILIVDDHPIVRQGYAQLIGNQPDFEVCGVAASEQEALDEIARSHPHLAIVDISLKNSSGIELIETIHARHPDVKVLVASAHDENLFAERALEAGALGYINKQEATDRLIEGIRQVLDDEVFVSEEMTHRLLRNRVGDSKKPDLQPIQKLTNRELQVFEMIGHGETTQRIANRLGLSHKTIERYKENLKRKLNLANATELVQQATRWVLEDS
jgi:DNA-binding NarL/FixJ family response regulator